VQILLQIGLAHRQEFWSTWSIMMTSREPTIAISTLGRVSVIVTLHVVW